MVIVASAGITENEADVALLTFNVAKAGENALAAYVATIDVVPLTLAVAFPVASMVATATPPARPGADQVAAVVLSIVEPSLKVSNRVYFWVAEAGIVTSGGVTLSDTGVAALTVNAAVLESVPNVAVMFTVPTALPVASPLVGAVEETIAVEVFAEVQIAAAVLSIIEPSLNVSVAVYC